MIDETNTPTQRTAQGCVHTPVKLHVGYVGVTGDGAKVAFDTESDSGGLFEASNGLWYDETGFCVAAPPRLNIIGPWADPKEQATEYKPDTWYAWTGGECPVHEMDGVEYLIRGEINRWCTFTIKEAGDLRWGHIGDYSDIMLFKIVEPYVETRAGHPRASDATQ